MAAVTPSHPTATALSAGHRSPPRARHVGLLAGLIAAVLLGARDGGGGSAPPAPAPAPATAPLAAPAITTEPANQTITENTNAGFSVVATGSALAYQWQRSTDAGASWTDISGATTNPLILTAVPLSRDGERFRVRVSNSTATVVSQAARLTVNAAGAARAWQTAERLRATDGLGNGTNGPGVAGNGLGEFIVAWVDADTNTGDRSLLTRRYTPANGWGSTDLVASWTSADRPGFHGFSVGLAPNGTAAIVFIGRSNLRDSLYGSHQTAGGAWAAPTLLEDDDLGATFSRMALVMDNNGVATAVWGQDFDVFPAVFNTRRALAARMAADGTWGPYVDIDFPAGSGNPNGINLTPRLAVNANGDVAAGWTNNIISGPNAGQYAAATVFTQAGGWGTPALLTTPVSGYNSILEDVAIAADGSAAASVHRTSPVVGQNRSVLLARYTSGGGWASAVEVDQTAAESLFSRVALANDGTAVVIWQQAAAGGNLLYTNTVSSAGVVGTASMLSASAGSIISGSAMQRDGAGNIIVVWGAYEPGYKLVSRVRDTAGTWATQTAVSPAVSGISFDSDSALAVSANGTAAAIWYVQDGLGGTVPWANVYR